MSTEETLLWKGSPSQWTNFGTYFVCVLLVAADVVIYKMTSYGPIVFVGLLVPVFLAFSRWSATRSNIYEITTERIRVSQGMLSRTTTEMELYRVRDYTIVEPFWLRLVGCGNLVLQTADRSNPLLVLHAVPRVAALKDEVRNHTERMRQLRGVRDLEIDPQAPPS